MVRAWDHRRVAGTLYLVGTPIGNLGDLSPRAADTLRNADLILAEDTRVSGKLLAHAESRAPMIRYDDHSSASAREAIVSRLGSEAVALVSDAGTPLISDPGYKLVRAAREAGHAITTIPGPSAAIAALTLAALPTDRFLFAGFLPPKAKARSDAIAELADVRATLVFYESGPRLTDTLEALSELLGAREAAVAREFMEEAGIHVADVRYLSSQPWPFPSSLMIGCAARALDDRLTIDTTELDDARWFSREEVALALASDPAAPFLPPPRFAIARTLLEHWLSGAQSNA